MSAEDRDQTARQTITQILSDVRSGHGQATDLMPLLYRELRGIADGFMRGERDNHTLQPTALVHEAFVRLVDNDVAEGAARHEFLAAAANTMRRILIDHARKVGTDKRGGGWERVTLDGMTDDADAALDVVDLHEALDRLAELDERQAKIVELRFFGGMTGAEIAEHLGISRNTVVREIAMARAWLHRELEADQDQ